MSECHLLMSLFSAACYTVNKKRRLFEPHTVNMLVCLQDWMKKRRWINSIVIVWIKKKLHH